MDLQYYGNQLEMVVHACNLHIHNEQDAGGEEFKVIPMLHRKLQSSLAYDKKNKQMKPRTKQINTI